MRPQLLLMRDVCVGCGTETQIQRGENLVLQRLFPPMLLIIIHLSET